MPPFLKATYRSFASILEDSHQVSIAITPSLAFAAAWVIIIQFAKF